MAAQTGPSVLITPTSDIGTLARRASSGWHQRRPDAVLCDFQGNRNQRLPQRLSRAHALRVVQVNADDKRGPLSGLRALRDGHGIGLLADQGPRQGYHAWFLGQAVIAHRGAGLVVKPRQKPMVVGCCLRASTTRSVVYVFPLPQPPAEASDEDIVQQAMDAMGRLIMHRTGQYFWHHKRFKRHVEHTGTADQTYKNKLSAFYQENNLATDSPLKADPLIR